MNDESDVYKKRRMMKNFAEGKFTPEDITFAIGHAEALPSVYGNLETISKEDASSGRLLEASCHGETRQYFVPGDSAWISGKGIRIDKAYRIFEQDDTTLTVREIKSALETQAIREGYMQEIRRVLERNKEKSEEQ